MINAVAMLSGGMWVQRKLGDLNLPSFSRPVDEVGAFKFSVRVHAANIPGLSDPSLLKRERPRVEVVLGFSKKETELGDYRPEVFRERDQPEESSQPSDGIAASQSEPRSMDWQFGDTLTFVATRADVLGPGAQVWLRTQGEVRLGSLLQMNMAATTDVGVSSVDIRRRVLPACRQKTSPDSTGGSANADLPISALFSWESPVFVMPLTHIGGNNPAGGSEDRKYVLGEAVGHVALSFGVNMDPDVILKSADEATMPFVTRVVQPITSWTVKTASVAANLTSGHAATAAVTAKDWTVQAANATVVGMKWAIENSDIEGCTVKTRKGIEDFVADQGVCGHQFQQETGTPINFGGPFSRPTMSPVGSPPGQIYELPSRHMSFGMAGQSSVYSVPVQAVPRSLPNASGQPPGPEKSKPPDNDLVRQAVDGNSADDSSQAGSQPPSSSSSRPPFPKPAARSVQTSPGAAVQSQISTGSVGVRSIQTALGAAVQAVSTSGSGVRSVQTKYVVQRPNAQSAGASLSASQRQQPAQSQTQVAGLPTRQSFQAVHVIPYGGYGGGLPSRQSFRTAQQSKPLVAPPQYVRPGTIS